MLDIGKEKHQDDCPECGTIYSFTLEQVTKGKVISCSKCGLEIELKDGGNVAKSIKDVNKAFDDFQKSLDQLGKL